MHRLALLLAGILLAGALLYAAIARHKAIGGLLSPGVYPVRVVMPGMPQGVQMAMLEPREIPDLAVPPELAAAEDGGEPVADAAALVAAEPVTGDPGVASTAPRGTARADFLTSFSDLAEEGRPAPQPPAARAPTTSAPPRASTSASDNGVLDIAYDLDAGPGSDGSVTISKRLRRNGASLGPLKLQVDRNSGLYASRADLARMLPAKAAQIDRLDGDFLSLSRLRQAGVNLRYDAARDELVVQE